MEEVFNFLKEAKTYYLCTVDGNKPDARPFGTVNIYEGKLYIQTGKSKNVYKQIIANPNVEICAMNTKGEWIRINAEAVEDDSVEASEAMLQNYPELRPMYTPGDGNCTTFYLKDANARICSFTAEPKTITF